MNGAAAPEQPLGASERHEVVRARRSFARTSPAELLFGRWSVAVAAVVVGGAVAGSLIEPWGAAELSLCWFRRISGLPCPGCGLTRAVISLARGELVRSLEFHPFGVVVLPWAAAAASFPFWPSGLRQRVVGLLDNRASAFDRNYRVLVYGLVGFGTLRFLAVALGYWSGP
jgi:hypothetical protein